MKGFTLLEVMLSLFLFSVVICVFFEQKTLLKRSLLQAYYKQIAIEAAVSLQNRLAINQSLGSSLREIAEWRQELADLLPHGEGKISSFNQTPKACMICWRIGGKQCITKLLALPY
jgi:prepilin-type N-terminal cleavage/methylation domain-containing protein